jgi:hypothetical protein
MDTLVWVIAIGIFVFSLVSRLGKVTTRVAQRVADRQQAQAAGGQQAAARAQSPEQPQAAPPPPAPVRVVVTGAPARRAPVPPRPPASASLPPLQLDASLPGLAGAPATQPSPMRAMLHGAFHDAAHARSAIILGEVLAKPIALR